MTMIDRGRSIPIAAESGQRFGERSNLHAAMAAYVLLCNGDRAAFAQWLSELPAPTAEKEPA